MILRARVVLPISQPPIDDGAVVVSGPRIRSVGRYAALSAQERTNVVDLGETILLPGLINAHCHLDYTGLGGRIPPRNSFTEWIKSLVALKAEWGYTDFALSWLNGARMLLRSGVTTVADIEAVPELLPDLWETTPLRVISFRELISLRSRFAVPEQVNAAVREWETLPGSLGRLGLSPHAPYTTSADLLQRAARASAERHWPLTTHLSESAEEFEMFLYRLGPLHDWLKNQRDMSDCGAGSPVRHLERVGYLSDRLLAAHVNYLGKDDAAILARHGVHVVHCPRSHAFFKHQVFPRRELARAGVNICLGTDSLASVLTSRHEPLELDFFAELKTMAALAQDLPPFEILKMATLNGALALHRPGEIGELVPNALADLIALPFSENRASAYDAVLHHSGPVRGSMIGGKWAIDPTHAPA